MLTPWLVLLVSVTAGQEVNESTEDTTLKTTTLYPVANKTIGNNKNRLQIENQRELKSDVVDENNVKEKLNEKEKLEVIKPFKEEVSTWAVNADYAQPKDNRYQAIYTESENERNRTIDATHAVLEDREVSSVHGKSHAKEKQGNLKKDEETDDSNSTDSKEQFLIETSKSNGIEKKFKPSPHLGNFFDDENLNLLKFSTFEPPVFRATKPTVDFLGSKDYYFLNYKSPEDTYRGQMDAPYRFKGAQFLTTNNWKQTLESKPTVESSVKIPAGGLYKQSNAFKEKPSSDTYDDFGIGFNENGKENPVRQRSNPWKSLVQLVTAFLPVGLIISALTPNIITLQTTNNDPYLGRRSRRSRAGFVGVPAISEHCRRRLLCELRSEQNYTRFQDKSGYARKHCYKLRCEDPETLTRVLAWLLAYRSPLGSSAQAGRDHTDILEYRHRNNDFT